MSTYIYIYKICKNLRRIIIRIIMKQKVKKKEFSKKRKILRDEV